MARAKRPPQIALTCSEEIFLRQILQDIDRKLARYSNRHTETIEVRFALNPVDEINLSSIIRKLERWRR